MQSNESTLHGHHAIATLSSWPELLRFCLFFEVVARDAIYFVLGAQNDADAFVQLAGLKVQNSLAAIGGCAASLFNQPAHWVGFVHQAQLAGFVRFTLVPGVHEDTATGQNSVHIGHHAGNPAHVEVFAAHAIFALQALVNIAFDGCVPMSHVAHVDGKFFGVFWHSDIFLG